MLAKPIEKNFEKQFDYGSILPFLLSIIGFYSIFLMINNFYSQAFFVVMIGFLVYVINNIVINVTGFSTVFNEYLEDFGSYLTFGLTTIIFGFLFYKGDILTLILIFVYGIALLLSLARDWILRVKNSLGWPIALNGIFFPLIYYFYLLYLKEPGNSIFIIYYILISLLSVSKINFLGYNENSKDDYDIVEIKPISELEKTEKDKKNDGGENENKEKLSEINFDDDNNINTEQEQDENQDNKENNNNTEVNNNYLK